MSLANTTARYGAVAMSFHWLTALLILTVIPLGIIAHDMAHALNDPEIASTQADIQRTALLFSIHKTTGILIFFVALARIAWALFQTKPAPLHAERRLETFLAETVHWLLYGSLLLVPLTGWAHHAATVGFAPIWWPFGQSLPFIPKDQAVAEVFGTLHVVLERVLVVSIFLHVAGALKHQFVDRDDTLRRMLPGNSDIPAPAKARHSATPAVAALVVWGVAISAAAGMGLFTHHGAPATESVAAAPPSAEANWQVVDGTLALSITQMGNEVAGTFANWTAEITFEEPEAPGPAGDVEVRVDIPSLTLGGVTQQAMGPDFFDSAQFPTARFEAEITKTDSGYVATGPLTIRDVSLPATLPFELTLEGDQATMSGTLELQRLAYGVGQSVSDPATLGLDVKVAVTLTARRKAAMQ